MINPAEALRLANDFQGYDPEPRAFELLNVLLSAEVPSLPGEESDQAFGQSNVVNEFDELSYDAASQAFMRMLLDPATPLSKLWAAMQALRPAWSRAVLLGPVKAEMNARCTPHHGECEADQIHLWSYCQWCHATDGVELCADCSVAGYCNRSCQELDAQRHNLWCYRLLVSRLLWCAIPHEALVFQQLARRSPLTPYQAPKAVPFADLPNDWTSFFKERFATTSVLERLLLTESLSSALTLLRILDVLALREEQRTLRVLLVGADNEADAPWVELLPHLAGPLELVLVGPRLPNAAWSDSLPGDPRQREVRVECRRSHLQDLAADELGAMDVAVAFNSGMIFYKEWPSALPLLHSCRCPLAVTAWDIPEALQVQQLLRDANFEDNPFASYAPHRVTDDHGTTMFGNLVLFITRPRASFVWRDLLYPASGGPPSEDLRDALRLIQGHLEVSAGRRAELEMILDSPKDFRELIEKDDFRIPADICSDMAEAYQQLALGAQKTT